MATGRRRQMHIRRPAAVCARADRQRQARQAKSIGCSLRGRQVAPRYRSTRLAGPEVQQDAVPFRQNNPSDGMQSPDVRVRLSFRRCAKMPADATRNHRRAKGTQKKICAALQRTYPMAHCELNFTNPLQLLIATILSAQCTDKRLSNIVTAELFKKYHSAKDFCRRHRWWISKRRTLNHWLLSATRRRTSAGLLRRPG